MERTLPISSSRRALLASAICTIMVSSAGAAEPTPATDSDTGSVWWNEIVTENPDRTREFYKNVIGWSPKIVAADDHTRAPVAGEAEYTLFMQNNTESSGLTKYDGKEPSDPKPGWLMYIQVANVEEASLQAVKNGGKLLKAPYDATRIGRLSIIRDPDGNTVGLFTPPPKPAKE